jgi:hypothetical protein
MLRQWMLVAVRTSCISILYNTDEHALNEDIVVVSSGPCTLFWKFRPYMPFIEL